MNIRKPVVYSTMFAALDTLVAAGLPQMELYCEISRLASSRMEKGAAVAAAEYLCDAYPNVSGFSLGTCAGCGNSTAPMRTCRKRRLRL